MKQSVRARHCPIRLAVVEGDPAMFQNDTTAASRPGNYMAKNPDFMGKGIIYLQWHKHCDRKH